MNRVIHLAVLAAIYCSPVFTQDQSNEPSPGTSASLSPEEQKKRERLLHSGRNEEHPCPAGGIAMGGYDSVSYFQGDEPLMGLADFELTHGECTYRFANEANRDAFAANPNQYLPEYGGWCATALAMGRLTCPDFTNYKVENDRLLLFEVTAFTNGRFIWDQNRERLRQRADENFDLLEKAQ